jgi:hypothetical protein
MEFSRMQFAQWVLERNLEWVSAADVKAGTIFAIDAAMLGALAAFYQAADANARTPLEMLLSVAAAVCALISIFCVGRCVLPQTKGPKNSLIFFDCIKTAEHASYADSIRGASHAQLLDDCVAQIHRNAEIACQKFAWVHAALIWTFVAMPLWVAALIGIVAE